MSTEEINTGLAKMQQDPGAATRELYSEYVVPTYAPNMVLVRGHGSYVWDASGKKYLDFVAGIAVSTLGHGHPALVGAIRDQAQRIIHTSNLYYNEVQGKVARLLSIRSLGGKCFFSNSGAEANEAMIKLARLWGSQKGRYEIITVDKSFHGRTMMTLTATAQEKVQTGFSPLPPGFKYAKLNDLESIKEQITPKTVAVMVEPIQGEGGINPATEDFMRGLRTLCDNEGILLLCDEIQTGIGRTGEWFGYQHFGIMPDAISVAKGLGGGLPIGALVTSPKLADVLQPGKHGSTFGGNPLACAAALAVLQTVEKKKLVERAEQLGDLIVKRLEKMAAKYPCITEIRGTGLMIGIVMNRPCKELESILLRNGLITVATAENVIRLVPPLTVSNGEVKRALKMIDKGCKEWQQYHG
jgi:predicted acetylornithine/succinylornithine family transaminase